MKLNLAPIVITGVAASPPIPVDTRLYTTSMGVNIVISATATAQLQQTMDDIWATGWTAGTGSWVNVGAAVTTPGANQINLIGTTAVFATALRVNVTASSGTVTVQAWQAANLV